MLDIVKNYEELSATAAEIVRNVIYNKPDAILGLPTGATPMGMYQELIKLYAEGKIDFSKVTTFNLDEYCNLKVENENSYHSYMKRNFFDHININTNNINIPDGNAIDMNKSCREYDEKICKCGGIDLLILGIGHNGHIGFNEPSSEMIMNTHVTDLADETIKANARYFAKSIDKPRQAVTMGLEGIMTAKQILLLVDGKNKVTTVSRLLEKKVVSSSFPASFLHLHKDAIMIINENAIETMKLIAQ